MNNLKFRVWDKANKEMLKIDVLDFFFKEIRVLENDGSGFSMKFQDVEIMQSTGFKDKNGKEIFEGDILNCGYIFTGSPFEEQDDYIEDIGVVKIMNCGAVVKIYEEIENLVDVLDSCEDIEVIGNIYENKELKKNARIK